MSFLIVVGGLALVSFALAYIRPGRYGPAALSLAAGYIFALFWADTIAGSYREFGQTFGISPWRDAVYAGLIIAPALLALFVSPKRQSILPRPIGALAQAALAVAFLLPIFSLALVADAQSRSLYGVVEENKELIVTAALGLGVADIMFARHPKHTKRGKD